VVSSMIVGGHIGKNVVYRGSVKTAMMLRTMRSGLPPRESGKKCMETGKRCEARETMLSFDVNEQTDFIARKKQCRSANLEKAIWKCQP
jgi:hypothetical protein